jgi:hypothetical protein
VFMTCAECLHLKSRERRGWMPSPIVAAEGSRMNWFSASSLWYTQLTCSDDGVPLIIQWGFR